MSHVFRGQIAVLAGALFLIAFAGPARADDPAGSAPSASSHHHRPVTAGSVDSDDDAPAQAAKTPAKHADSQPDSQSAQTGTKQGANVAAAPGGVKGGSNAADTVDSQRSADDQDSADDQGAPADKITAPDQAPARNPAPNAGQNADADQGTATDQDNPDKSGDDQGASADDGNDTDQAGTDSTAAGNAHADPGSVVPPKQTAATAQTPAPGTMAPPKATPASDQADDSDDSDDSDVPGDQPATPKAPLKRESVAVLPYAAINGDLPQTTGDKIGAILRNEITSANALDLVDLNGKSPNANPGRAGMADARTKIADVLATLDKVKHLMERRRIRPALSDLQKGISGFLESFQGADDFKPLSDAYARLAVLRFMQGNDDASNRALDDLIRIDPERSLTQAGLKALTGVDISDEIIRRFHREQKSLWGKSRWSVRINSAPTGAHVVIDGVSVGATPLLAKGLLPGDHYVVVSTDVAGAFWKKISPGSETVTLNAILSASATGPLAHVSKRLSRNVVDGPTQDAIRAVGEAAHADYVVFGGVKKDGDNLTVKSFALRTKDGTIADLMAVSVDPSLLGAEIEMVKVADDLISKRQTNEFDSGSSLTALFDGVAPAPQAAEAVNEVIVTPPSIGGSASQDAGDTVQPVPEHRRGPVTAESEPAHRGPVTADSNSVARRPVNPDSAIVHPRNGESALQQLEDRRRARRHHGRAVVSDDQSASDNAGSVDDTNGSDSQPSGRNDLNLNAPPHSDDSSAGLSVEQLAELRDAQQSHVSAGKIALWTSVGVIGAAALTVGAFFLFRPTSPSSATASIKWSP